MPALVPPVLPAGTLSCRPQPCLTGRGVRLRPWQEADAPVLVAAYSDRDIQRWHCRALDAEEAVAQIVRWRQAWHAETAASWAVTDDAGVVLGRVAFREADLSEGLAEIAYWVLPGARRRGVATAAVEALCGWAFDEVGLHRIELLHSVANPGSCEVAAAAGFELEGTLRSCVLHADGWHDMHLHARLSV